MFIGDALDAALSTNTSVERMGAIRNQGSKLVLGNVGSISRASNAFNIGKFRRPSGLVGPALRMRVRMLMKCDFKCDECKAQSHEHSNYAIVCARVHAVFVFKCITLILLGAR